MVSPSKFSRPAHPGRYEEYHPYGSTAWWAGNAEIEVSRKRYRYTGMERDEETGLQCHGVRYYAPWVGRWTSADPIGLGDGGNRFGYCHGSPTARIDRNGQSDEILPGILEGRRAVLSASEDVTTGTPRVLLWSEAASTDARTFRNVVEPGVPNQPTDPSGPGTLDAIPQPSLLSETLESLRARSNAAGLRGTPSEYAALYFVTKGGAEGVILAQRGGADRHAPTQDLYDALSTYMEANGLSYDDITVVEAHSHPVDRKGQVNGFMSSVQTDNRGRPEGDQYGYAGYGRRTDAIILASQESAPLPPTGSSGSVLEVLTKNWRAVEPGKRMNLYKQREETPWDSLRSGTFNPVVQALGDFAVTQTQQRAGYPDRYVLYVANPVGAFERVRFSLPSGGR